MAKQKEKTQRELRSELEKAPQIAEITEDQQKGVKPLTGGTQHIIGIRSLRGNLVKGFDIRIDNEDVYVNYSDCSTPEAHCSYHASGQHHTKVAKNYIQWTGGYTGGWGPMKLFKTPPALVSGRVQFWTVGWELSKLETVLPALEQPADMTVDTRPMNPQLILGFEVDVIGDEARKLESILGYPIVWSAQFGSAIRIEVNAFLLVGEPVSS